MNSLQQLNGFSANSITYTDDRDTAVIFSSPTATNQNFTAYENIFYRATPGIEILDVISPVQDITYTLRVPASISANIYWPSLSGGLVSNSITSGGFLYKTMYGISTAEEWDLVRDPKVTSGTIDPYTITSTITYNGNTISWTSAVSVISLNELSVASDHFYATDIASSLAGAPQVVPIPDAPQYATDNYTLTVTPSNVSVMGNLVSSGIGTSSFNNTTKVLTITGNVAKLNSHLNNITYTPATGVDASWIATYSLYNPVTVYTSTRQQFVKSITEGILTRPNVSYYREDFLTTIGSNAVPQITDSRLDTTYYRYFAPFAPFYTDEFGNPEPGWDPDQFEVAPGFYSDASYRVVVTPVNDTVVSNVTVPANYYTPLVPQVNYTQTTDKTISMWGARAELNAALRALQVQGNVNYTGEINLNYTVTAPRGNINQYGDPNSIYYNQQYTATPAGNTVTRVQTLYGNIQSGFVNNMTVTRSFNKNTPYYLFFDPRPTINETLPGTYTIYLSTTAGHFGTVIPFQSPGPTSENFSFSGTYNEVNNIFYSIFFYPYKDVSGEQSFNYSQYHNGNAQIINQTVGLVGSGNATITGNSVATITSSGIWNPSFEQKYYFNRVNFAVIGGGGGGAGATTVGAGGGGGGNIKLLSNVNLITSNVFNYGVNIPVTVGSGGFGGRVLRAGAGGTSIIGNISSGGGGGGIDYFAEEGGQGGFSSNGFGGGQFSAGSGLIARGGGGHGGAASGLNGGPGSSFTIYPGYGTGEKYCAGGGSWHQPNVGTGGDDGGGSGGSPGSNYGSGGGARGFGGGGGRGANGVIIAYFHNV
jgi:hypothetical protein